MSPDDPRDEADPVDPLAVLRAQIDQWAAMAPEIARMIRARYLACQAEGFSETQALYLAAATFINNPGTAP